MNFIISASTDVGNVKSTNQDSLSVKLLSTVQGKMAFAVLCDGMGGLSKGEVASAQVIRAFDAWVYNELPVLSTRPIDANTIMAQWQDILKSQNRIIKAYGARQGVKLGTTAVVMLLTDSNYYVMNVGDSRAYEICEDSYTQITYDQTFVAREVSLGHMTPEQAELDERRSVLLQCVGASEDVHPDFFSADIKANATYMLCSDGFRHEISAEEIYSAFRPAVLVDAETMEKNAYSLIELNKQRNERDNISVALVRSF